jgi:hypothetical protein
MSNERLAHVPTPHLRTRPATMLTAIGLCVIIMLLQLVPEIQDTGSRSANAASTTVSAARTK